MRLVDKVANSPPQVSVFDANGMEHRVIGVGGKADAVRNCELRYMLDKTTSRECTDLVLRPNQGLLDPSNELLRLPAESFWIEWFETPTDSQSTRVGALIECDPGGRSGTISGYWEEEQGRPDTIGVAIFFDLDRPMRSASLQEGINIKQATLPHLDSLFSHSITQVDEGWQKYFKTRNDVGFTTAMRDVAQGTWYFLPFVMAFSAMLNSREVVEQHPSQLDRLNVARARRGRVALLDHVEVRMVLGGTAIGTGSLGGLRSRGAPRLHHVRGHFVHRAGSTFWRASHLRGDNAGTTMRKTVMVSGHVPRQLRYGG